MNYLERYQNGEYEQVWKELQDLGAGIRREPYYSEAQAVAAETMRRVRRNCERLVSRLQTLGYVFGTFPDGKRRGYKVEPLTRPSDEMQDAFDELESEAGPLPLSLSAFWQEVGAVDFVGMHRAWPTGLDPLVVDPPQGPLSDYYDYEREEGEAIFVGLAPDDFHKDNVSGGDPYGLELPNPAADFPFMYESHDLLFVPYLRLAILQWGGFPGLDAQRIQFEPLAQLITDLEPF
jgi:hypothetical protein